MSITIPIPQHLIEEGRDHPFIRAIVTELRIMEAAATKSLVGNSANGGADWMLRMQGGRVAAVQEVLRLIETSVGKEEET